MAERLKAEDDRRTTVDDETRLLLDKIGMAVGLGLIVLALIGEVLGWWNDVGLILGGLGMALGAISALDHNGREIVMLVRPLPRAVEALGAGQASLGEGQWSIIEGQQQMHAQQRQMLSKQGQMLSQQDQMLSKQDQMLSQQEQMLSKQDQVLSKQDTTNGHLVRIVEILDERLPRVR